MDDYQQGLVPGGSEPRNLDYNKYLAMPRKPSILDMMRQEIDDSDEVHLHHQSARTLQPVDSSMTTLQTHLYSAYIQRVVDAPMHSTPYPDPPTLSARSGPTLLPPRPCSSSVPTTPKTIKRMALRYMPITETVSPPILPPRAPTMDPQSEPDSPSPTRKTGRSKKQVSWQVARPSDGEPWCGNQEQNQEGRTRPGGSHTGTGLAPCGRLDQTARSSYSA